MQINFRRSQFKIVILPAILVAGLALSLYDYLEDQEGLSSNDWLPAPGKILTNTIRAERTLMSKMIFIPSASYSYHVSEDEVLRGDRVSFPDHVAAPEKDLKPLLERLEVGHKCISYYDPKNHAHATMVRGVRHSKYFILFLRDAVITVLSGVFALSSWLRRREKV
jgi:hypothetical protein